MREQLSICWRAVAATASLMAFGFGSLFMGLLFLPFLRLAMPRHSQRATVVKGVVHQAFRLFVSMLRLLGLLSCEVRGATKLHRVGMLVLANHPSLLDVVLLMTLMRRPDCVVKASLGGNLFIGGPVRAAGFVFSNSGSRLVDLCVESVRSGNNLIIFPEGTRTVAGSPMRLHRSAATVAVRGNFDVTPVRIHCSPPLLGKGCKWYRIPSRRPHFVIDVGEDLPVSPFIEEAAGEGMAARRLNQRITEYLSMEIERAPS